MSKVDIESGQTIESLVAESIENVLKSDAISEKIKGAAESAIESAIREAFGHGSRFRKSLREKIDQAIPIVDVDELSWFSNAVMVVIRERLSRLSDETARVHVGKVLDELIPNSSVIELKDLKVRFSEKVKWDAMIEAHGDCDDMDFLWREEKSEKSDYWDLLISTDPDAGPFDKETIRMRFRPSSDDHSIHECWHVNREYSGTLFAGPLFGFDAMLFRLATGISKLRK